MPIYAYKCQGCGHKLEKIQRLSDALLTDCPECNLPQLKKQVTAAAFKLTGTGWYETDFKNKSTEKAKPDTDSDKSTKGDSCAKSEPDSGSDGKKSETKPDSKESKSETKSKSKKDAA